MPQANAQLPAGDPVRLDPKHYAIEFENERVRVMRVKYGPHERSAMHRHPAMLTVSLANRDLQFTLRDGRTQDILGRAGEIIWYDPHEHLPENLSSQPYEGIHIELRGQT